MFNIDSLSTIDPIRIAELFTNQDEKNQDQIIAKLLDDGSIKRRLLTHDWCYRTLFVYAKSGEIKSRAEKLFLHDIDTIHSKILENAPRIITINRTLKDIHDHLSDEGKARLVQYMSNNIGSFIQFSHEMYNIKRYFEDAIALPNCAGPVIQRLIRTTINFLDIFQIYESIPGAQEALVDLLIEKKLIQDVDQFNQVYSEIYGKLSPALQKNF